MALALGAVELVHLVVLLRQLGVLVDELLLLVGREVAGRVAGADEERKEEERKRKQEQGDGRGSA